MEPIGIVGAGTMGRGIAHVAALSGFDTYLYDVSSEIVRNALRLLSEDLQKGVAKGKLTADRARAAAERVRPSSSLKEFAPCGIVIEAAVEEISAKKKIFAELEASCRPGAILATNTSSLSVTAIAAGLKHPGRVLGLHFFNPPHLMTLVEVVRGIRTSDETLRAALALTERFGKRAVVAKDTPGFIVNRLARPFYGEALRLLGEGVATAAEIDRIVKLEGGFRMGPFELMDLIGIDVNLAVTKSIYEQTFGEPRYRPHPIQQQMVNAGRLGRKSRGGFYDYNS
jgi:3-hydroxybutyryl-CoA dehydrogenase